ncbi:MAG: lipopolysaccharide kinase InaA family protein [Candidatus ainarchaeum sp.]|nr:lipopolysaccharide kinase InaA family protein [Candidatus ainarchaeum sp.]
MPRKQPQKIATKKQYVAPKCIELRGKDVSIWQTKERRDMVQWKLETDPPDIARRRLALLAKGTKKCLGQKNVTIFVKNVTQKELDIIDKLRKAGIFTEMPFDFKLKTAGGRERGPMGFLNAGESFAKATIRANNAKLRAMFMPVADIIGQMHALGVEHGHVTTSNVHIHNGRLCLVDFSIAEQHLVDWNSVGSIYNAFVRDYTTRITRSKSQYANMTFCKEFFRRMISHYPTSEQIKSELINKLNNDLENYRSRDLLPYHGPC